MSLLDASPERLGRHRPQPPGLAPAAMGRRYWQSRWRKWMPGYLLVLPAVALIATMMVYPVLQTLYFSVSRVQLPTFRTTFVGLDNFIRILQNPDTGPLVQRTLVWVVGIVVCRIALGLAAALVFNAKVPGTVWLRVLVILPWTIPSVVGANLWRWIFQTDSGVLNQTLRSWGLGDYALNWLGDPSTAMAAVIVAYTWAGFPFVMLLILARMQGIPAELYEAARIDGANWWHLFRYITLPSLKSVLVVALILEIVSGLNSFDTLVIMTGGGPAKATQIWGLEIYKTGFAAFNLGGASALSVLMFIAVLIAFVFYSTANRALHGQRAEAMA
jgi:ABC-type sugar transport system permease subunit